MTILKLEVERKVLEASDAFVYTGHYQRALHSVNDALRQCPDHLRGLLLKADILFCLSEDEEALKVIELALIHHPFCVEAHLSKAGLLEMLGQDRDALASCNQAFLHLTDPTRYLLPALFDQKLMLLIRLRKFQQAKRIMRQASQVLEESDFRALKASYQTILSRRHHSALRLVAQR
jgi:tetratricopeptide (TPR) repeat protein